MENSENYKATIELGRKIAEELGTTTRTDFLGGWMAHYVAGLIEQYDNASAERKKEAGDRAFKAILKLWNHRYRSPSGFDPIKSSEIILRTLNRLDPESKRPFYFFNHREEDRDDEEDYEHLFEMAMGVDRTARRLLKMLILVMTIKKTNEETADYIRLAMPDHLNDDLKAIDELMNEVDSEDFAQVFQDLKQQIHAFGTLCVEFGSSENTRSKPD